jgi:iron complex transport system substrate-binding protein
MRICSLLPGATEVVAALGLSDDVVGVSHECDYPASMTSKPVFIRPAVRPGQPSRDIDAEVRETVGAGRPLYLLDEDRFVEAHPDLVITQDLCAVCAITPDQLNRALARLTHHVDVLALGPTTLMDVLTDIRRIGEATDRRAEAGRLVSDLMARLELVRTRVSTALTNRNRPRVACLEWLEPLFVGGHWVPEMVEWAGGRDVLGRTGEPSRTVEWRQIADADPDVIVLMPCGFTAEQALAEQSMLQRQSEWHNLTAVRRGRVYAVDAVSYFSRPGPRLVDGIEILAELFHLDTADAVPPSRAARVPAR